MAGENAARRVRDNARQLTQRLASDFARAGDDQEADLIRGLADRIAAIPIPGPTEGANDARSN